MANANSTPAVAYDINNQIEIQSLTLKKPNSNVVLDISALMEQLIIYEDLFQTALSAAFIFTDQVNLVGNFPIVGGETISISYKTPFYTEVISQDWIVYKVGDRGVSNSTENIQATELGLCTPEVWYAANNDASAGYQGTYTDIIGRLLQSVQTKKPFTNKEDSVGIVTYVAPSCNTFQAIKFCANRANTQTMSPMFFWESPSGYNLKSLKELYRADYDKILYISPRNLIDASDPERLFNTVYDFDYCEGNNRLKQYSAAAFGANNYSVDLNNKTISKTNNTYDDVFTSKDIKLNKYPLNDPMKSSRSLTEYIPWRVDGSHIQAYDRLANLSMMDNLRLMINIPGDSKMKAGDVVWLDIPSRSGLGVDVEKLSSGKWMVRSIKHLITKRTFSQTCELTKDSFDADTSTM